MDYRKYLLIFLCSLLFHTINAQNNCLKKAQRLFDDGQLSQIPSILQPCFSSFTRDEKVEAYKLLTLVWLYCDEFGKADTAIQKILLIKPDYPLSATEDKLFLSLYSQYRTKPLYSYGISTGTNFTRIQPINKYGVYNLHENSEYTRFSRPGFRLGIFYNRILTNKLNIGCDINFIRNNYRVTQDILGFTKLSFSETQNKLLFPVCIEYSFNFRKVEPYFLLGFSTEILLNSNATVYREFKYSQKEKITGAPIKMTHARRIFNFSAIAGAGMKYKVRKSYFYLDVKYFKGILKQNDPTERYSNNELVFNYYYIESDFKLNMLLFSFGYAISIYKPVKINAIGKQNEEK